MTSRARPLPTRAAPGYDVEIWTDGSTGPDAIGAAGWAAVLLTRDREGHHAASGGRPSGTSMMMEVLAATSALELLPTDRYLKVRLWTDCLVLRDAVDGNLAKWQRMGWRNSKGRSIPSRHLWQALAGLLELHDIDVVWVKGHSADPMNTLVNALARKARLAMHASMAELAARFVASDPATAPQPVVMAQPREWDRWDSEVGRWDSPGGTRPTMAAEADGGT